MDGQGGGGVDRPSSPIESDDLRGWARAWQSFYDLNDMFPTKWSARVYLVGLGGYWGLGAVAMVTNSPAVVVVPMVVCFVFVFIPIVRLLWVRRWPPTRFLVAYIAMINIPCQVLSATGRAGWKRLPAGIILGSLFVLDLVIVVTVVAPRSI